MAQGEEVAITKAVRQEHLRGLGGQGGREHQGHQTSGGRSSQLRTLALL